MENISRSVALLALAVAGTCFADVRVSNDTSIGGSGDHLLVNMVDVDVYEVSAEYLRCSTPDSEVLEVSVTFVTNSSVAERMLPFEYRDDAVGMATAAGNYATGRRGENGATAITVSAIRFGYGVVTCFKVDNSSQTIYFTVTHGVYITSSIINNYLRKTVNSLLTRSHFSIHNK